LVEDDACTRAFLEDALADMSVIVRVAGTAGEALEVLAAHADVRLAFVDRLLPDADGRELCHDLKHMRPGMKIVQMSSHPVGRVDANVVYSILDKPFTIEALELLISTIEPSETPPTARKTL
jgi:DNA-binding NtrC family response regulator